MFESTEALAMLAYGGGTGVGIAVGLQFMKWLLTFVAGRMDKQQEHIDAGMRSLIEGLRAEVDRMKVEAIQDRQEIAEVRIELRDCERKHSESEAKVAKLEAMMQGYGDAKQLAALQAAADKKGIRT